jgi:anti-sigma factor RsiW
MTFPMDSGRDCARAWEAMPWVLQNSAPQEQSDWLENHMAHCDACRAEYAQQKRLRLAVSLPSDIPVDANVGLRRLLGRLDMPDIQETPMRARSGGWVTRALVAAVLIQAVGISVLGVNAWSTSANTPYRTLSQETSLAIPGAIHVVPDAAMKLADWDALLRTLQLQVVGGPNDVGAYTVVPTSHTSTAQQTLQQLRGTKGIRLAEPVNPAP